ncbi:bile acid:sodium symporter family protein [Paracoccus sediminicola]|uniref:bile acid:sodium symporter family protein n=1 Tax=Paracoccus sediminicola TaxID=3017783 RepID=UPI0022F035D1|nr:hypothetical protein [Paracoccus sediminicola]WBU57046.1 hypothetical protein PAF18_00945 [Paracoccus sediminicola]
MTQFSLISALAVVMFTTGLSLRAGDFLRITVMPRAVVIGLALQMVMLPLAALGIGAVSGLSGDVRSGLMLAALAPATLASHVLVGLAGGHIGLARSMTAWSSVLVLLWSRMTGPAAMMIAIFAVVLPLLLGIVLAARFRSRATRIGRFAPALSSVLIGLLVLRALYLGWGGIDTAMLLAVGALCLAATGLGLLAARLALAGSGPTLAISTGMQNVAVPLVIGALGATPELATPAALYAIAMYVPAIALVAIASRMR